MDSCFTPLPIPFKEEDLPKRFTFPFYYTVHPAAKAAAEELMHWLEHQNLTSHDFGLNDTPHKEALGKMFGVLVVKDKNGQLGYLKAFSGKLSTGNHIPGFVPPVFDMLDPEGFYKKGEDELNKMNRLIQKTELNEDYLKQKEETRKLKIQAEQDLAQHKQYLKEKKKIRDQKRKDNLDLLSEVEYQNLLKELEKESLHLHYQFNQLKKEWNQKVLDSEQKLAYWEEKIQILKQERKKKSGNLQEQLFDQYNFLNKDLNTMNVREIFANTPFLRPPSGAGECATPKMLQYAFAHGMQVIAMAEFWWGLSPVSEIRKHKQYYPACRGKCEPILGFMLQNIPLDENPVLKVRSFGKLEIIFEDEHIVAINKPPELLSVPGKFIKESVLSLLQERYPDASGPLLVHRLDMSTSGILLAAKTKEAHQNIQAQFIKKTVKKRYTALLDGIISGNSGKILLPLRVDLFNRPQQIVCFEHGKMSETDWETVERKDGKTKVYFYPITGRTHQLRVHAAHPSGLNTAIVGDDLYGIKSDRLYLHADFLEIKHPATKQKISFEVPAPF